MDRTSFGGWVRSRRRALDLTQEDLANAVGCSPETIRKFEAERQRPSREMAERLAQKLGVDPSDRPSFTELARGVGRAAPQAAVATRPAELIAAPAVALAPPIGRALPSAARLPLPLDELVGREVELATLAALLRAPHARLLTLIGTGGVGKTRLAVEAARRARDDFPDGVLFVDLAATGDPAMLLPSIAQAIGASEHELGPAEALALALGGRRTLLVLDNLEQIVAAAPALATLLTVCQTLRMLATSRVALRVRGERELLVEPLGLPGSAERAASEADDDAPAAQLFLLRARAIQPAYARRAEDRAAVAAICALLDGVPLAIELAAARARTLAPEALLARLQSGALTLLTGGARDLPLRQRALRSAIAWSDGLLDAAERRLFARLAVFAGGWDIAAAAAVCGDRRGTMVQLPAIVDELETLVTCCLVRQTETAGTARYSMLATIREYAVEQLDASPEAATLRSQHAQFFLSLASDGDPQLRGPDAAAWLARIELEHANLRIALTWALEAPEAGDMALRLAVRLGGFWHMRGHWREGSAWLERALERPDGADQLRSDALGVRSRLSIALGDYPAALALAQAALAIAERLDDRRALALALGRLGIAASWSGERALARHALERALTIERERGDAAGASRLLNNLATIYQAEGEYAAARAVLEQSLAIKIEMHDLYGAAIVANNIGHLLFELRDYAGAAAAYHRGLEGAVQIDDAVGEAIGLNNLGMIAAYAEHDAALARQRYEAALAIGRRIDDRYVVALASTNLGHLLCRQGDYGAARAQLLVALAGWRGLGLHDGLAIWLEVAAELARDEQRWELAAELVGAADALRDAHRLPRSPANREDVEQLLTAALGSEETERARQRGYGATLTELLRRAGWRD